MRITRIRAAVALGATAACAATGIVVAAGSAQADGSFTIFHSAGSDTIQAVEAALGDNSGVINASGGAKATIYSYDAVTGNTTSGYQTHATAVTASGQSFVRPNGSGEGRLALAYANNNLPWPSTSVNDTKGVSLAGQIDIARSSGKPSAPGSDVTAVPLARDAFGVAIVQTAAGYAAHPVDSLTNAQVHDLYTTAGISGGNTVNGVTLVPWLPQSGSGTRGDFISKLAGITGNGQSIEPTKTSSDLVPVAHQHEENTLAATGSGACSTSNYFCSMLPSDNTTAYVIPFSAAQWISQQAGAQKTEDTTTITGAHTELVSLNAAADDTGSSLQPYTTGGTDTHGDDTDEAVQDYYAGFWGRDVYNVVPTAAITGTNANSALAKYLSKNLTSPAAQDVISSYGFLNVPYAGQLDTSDQTNTAPWGTYGNHVVLAGWETKASSGNTFGAARFPYTVSNSTVAIAGSPVVGKILTATGSFTPAASSYSYKWTVGGTVVGSAQTLAVPASAIGKSITLTVTGSKTNYSDAVVSVASPTIQAGASVVTRTVTKTVSPKALKTVRPKLAGKLASGKKLTAKPGGWTAGTKFKYAWFLNGVKKSSKSTYVIAKKSKGKVVQLEVTGSKAGYTTVTVSSFGKVVTK
jgi:hypothetical protein